MILNETYKVLAEVEITYKGDENLIIASAPKIIKLVEWKSVKKELPEPHTFCVVAMGEEMWADYYNEDGIWYNCKNVTHWMPLPAPPEKEEG